MTVDIVSGINIITIVIVLAIPYAQLFSLKVLSLTHKAILITIYIFS